MKRVFALLLCVSVPLMSVVESADAQRRGGGGFRGGGARGGGFRGGGAHFSRASARPSVSRPVSRPAFSGGSVARPATRPDVGRPGRPDIGQPGRPGAGIDRPAQLPSRPINIHDNVIGGGSGWDPDYGCCHYHPIARGAAFAAGAYAASAAIGSVVYTLPPACVVSVVNGITYEQCGSTWYQPQFVGTETTYVVVSPPQ